LITGNPLLEIALIYHAGDHAREFDLQVNQVQRNIEGLFPLSEAQEVNKHGFKKQAHILIIA